MSNEPNTMEEDVVDEGDGLILHEKPSNLAGLRGLVTSFFQRSSSDTKGSSANKLIDATEDDDFEEILLSKHRSILSWIYRAFRFPKLDHSIKSFIVLATCFALGVGVGCGLGLGIPYSNDTMTRLLNTIKGIPLLDQYGVPSDLPVIPIDGLINNTELNLGTGFDVSRIPAVREYEFNISHGLAAPDGFWKPMILANGQSPGPLIEANMGDTVRVRVNNLMPNTSTSIHFHGINQGNSTWMDGVAGVSQCGIPAAGGSWTYEFVIGGQRGTFWWHAHTGAQFTDGLFGPIVVHDPDEKVPETDGERILFLGENYHVFAAELAASYLSPSSPWSPDEAGVEPLSDNLLLNGRNTFNCSVISTTWPLTLSTHRQKNMPTCTGGQMYTTTIKPGSALRFRLINHSSYFSYWFSIDSHNLTIVEVDGVEIEPIVMSGVHLNIGQRYSVIVNAMQAVGNYTIRQSLERECFLPFSTYNSSGLEAIDYQGRGVLSYEDSGGSGLNGIEDRHAKAGATEMVGFGAREVNGTGLNPWGCTDMPFDKPVPKRAEAAYELTEGDPQHIIDFQFRQAGEVNRIFINRTSWVPYRQDAILWQALDQNFTTTGGGGAYNNWGFRLDQQVLLIPDGSGVVQLVINSLDVMEHPFHMHGHTVQIVGWGNGRYSGPSSSATTWNLANPMRRDTFTVPQQSHVVVRFKADNPGAWILHCHVAWHLEAGMATSFLERPGALKALIGQMDADTRNLSQSFCPKVK